MVYSKETNTQATDISRYFKHQTCFLPVKYQMCRQHQAVGDKRANLPVLVEVYVHKIYS